MNGLRVTKGAPLPEELAALAVALLAARRTGPATRPAPAGWCDAARRHGLRRPLPTGRHGWRESNWNLGGLL
ncbi:acyl-CoA carboxylase epsilon subunit [Sphaerisporangium viridialbum]|uniref:acyl-CoA carboxylase epsilon subunit n=1 Tax=Sphaerisporangium viridialbum TaxID=46189 RepID=UPI003C76AEE7